MDERKKEIDSYWIQSCISNEFFVWKTKSPNSYQAYKLHVRLGYSRTKELFQRSEKEKVFPKMYLLNRVVSTDEGAFRHCIAWTKYFVEKGFSPLAGEKILRYVDDLLPETEAIFNEIKDLALEDVLAENKLIVVTYKKIDKSKKRVPKNEIKFSVSKKEYEKIQKLAEENKLSMARYCKNMVLSGRVVELEPPPIEEHTAKLDEAKELLRQLLYAYYQHGKYYPADLENIQKAADRIVEAELQMSETFLEYAAKVMKVLPK